MSQNRSSRREFLKQTTAVSVGAIGFPYIVPASALGKDGRPPPSGRIVMGCIGLGGQGTGNMNGFMRQPEMQIVAVCDVERGRPGGGPPGRDQAKAAVEKYYAEKKPDAAYKGCDSYEDFRELLARPDIDAVTVCTPDHWHALVSVAAAKAGKDIYCEKPLANSVAEGRAIADAVKKNKVILQTGSQERSNPKARYAAELVRNGRIGKLKTIRINLPCTDGHHKDAMSYKDVPPPEPVPDTLNWDFWLGHTPKVDYTPRRCHFWWRFNLAYGGGEMTDRGAHIIDLAQLGNGTDDTGPIEIVAEGKRNPKSIYNTFWEYHFENQYANGVRMIGDAVDPRGLKFEGEDGWIFVRVHGCDLEASKPSIIEEKIKDDEIQLGRAEGGHHRNFIEAVMKRKDPFAPAEVGHRTASICHLNNIAMLVGKPLKWDPKAEKSNVDEANAMLMPTMRAPWHL